MVQVPTLINGGHSEKERVDFWGRQLRPMVSQEQQRKQWASVNWWGGGGAGDMQRR